MNLCSYQCVTLYSLAAALAPSVRAFAPQAEIWVFESQPRPTLVVKSGSYRSTAKRLSIDASFTGSRG